MDEEFEFEDEGGGLKPFVVKIKYHVILFIILIFIFTDFYVNQIANTFDSMVIGNTLSTKGCFVTAGVTVGMMLAVDVLLQNGIF